MSMKTIVASVVAVCLVLAHAAPAFATPPAAASRAVEQAWAMYQRGDCKRAQTTLAEALKSAPQYSPLYFNLGVSAERCGDPLAAVSFYRQYANAEPAQREWVFAHATALEQHAQAQEAAKRDHGGGIPWWGWLLMGVGVLVVAGGAAAGTSGGDSY